MMDDATALMDPPRTEARHTTDDHSGIPLRRVVLVNEEIKKVVGIAFRVNISALNAILLACKAGSSARPGSVSYPTKCGPSHATSCA